MEPYGHNGAKKYQASVAIYTYSHTQTHTHTRCYKDHFPKGTKWSVSSEFSLTAIPSTLHSTWPRFHHTLVLSDSNHHWIVISIFTVYTPLDQTSSTRLSSLPKWLLPSVAFFQTRYFSFSLQLQTYTSTWSYSCQSYLTLLHVQLQ